MATHYRTQGFFIKKVDQGEANQLFTVYTEDFGKLKILGRAIRKIKSKLRGGAEVFYLSEIEFIQGKKRKTLTDAILLKKYPNIRSDIRKLAVAERVAGVLDKVVGGEEPDKDLWNLLEDFFGKLNDHSPVAAYYYFLWNFFSILGYKPELYKCSVCGKKISAGALYFSFGEGGVICRECLKKAEKPDKVDSDTVKIVRIILNRDWDILRKLKISRDMQKSLNKLSKSYLDEILNKS